ncbi:MAG: tryptophan-rich sensory protein [Nitratireductor sp.]|nr:tryptophan-rich sensory protein [Nitratireductor sp.]MCB1460209.1 tryptophan-rich sensory protein [Nitratireductor sp.]
MSGLVFAILVFAAASSGAIFKPGEWYLSLKRPSWTPPGWAFPVVWTVLYIMIAISGWMVWERAGWNAAIAVWAVQLAINAAWSWLFFGLRRMDIAFIDVLLLLASVIGYIVLAWPISQTAAILFMPYALWVATAATLNYSVWQLNRDSVGA